jgi:hypothetical protein
VKFAAQTYASLILVYGCSGDRGVTRKSIPRRPMGTFSVERMHNRIPMPVERMYKAGFSGEHEVAGGAGTCPGWAVALGDTARTTTCC